MKRKLFGQLVHSPRTNVRSTNLLHSTSVRQCSESRSNLTPCGVVNPGRTLHHVELLTRIWKPQATEWEEECWGACPLTLNNGRSMNLLHSTSVRQCSESRPIITPCGVADQKLEDCSYRMRTKMLGGTITHLEQMCLARVSSTPLLQ